MNNREDPVRRLGIAGAQSPTSGQSGSRRAPRTSKQPPSEAPSPWAIVDGWVRNAKIRQHALIAFGLILAAVVIIVCVVALAFSPLLRDAANNSAGRIIGGALAGTGILGYSGVKLYRRRVGNKPIPTSTAKKRAVRNRRAGRRR